MYVMMLGMRLRQISFYIMKSSHFNDVVTTSTSRLRYLAKALRVRVDSGGHRRRYSASTQERHLTCNYNNI